MDWFSNALTWNSAKIQGGQEMGDNRWQIGGFTWVDVKPSDPSSWVPTNLDWGGPAGAAESELGMTRYPI